MATLISGRDLATEVLERSFVILPGIGAKKEADIWRSGILHWDAFLAAEHVKGISAERKPELDSELLRYQEAHRCGDSHLVCSQLGPRHAWRAYSALGDRAMSLDIETTGLDRSSVTTVVGLHDADGGRCLVRDLPEDQMSIAGIPCRRLTPARLQTEVDRAGMLVTFNGASFDLPFLTREFGTRFQIPHLDLRPPLRRLGFSGGLKRIETDLAIPRDADLEGITGYHAVRMWYAWQRDRDTTAFERLIRYNIADIGNLGRMADHVDRALTKREFHDVIGRKTDWNPLDKERG